MERVATDDNGFGLFEPFLGPSYLPPVAPARLHKRSILSPQILAEKADLGALEPPQDG